VRAVLKQALVSLEACIACKSIEQKVKQPAEKAVKSIKKMMA